MSSADSYFNKDTHILICDALVSGQSVEEIHAILITHGVPEEHTEVLIAKVHSLNEQPSSLIFDRARPRDPEPKRGK